MKRIFEYVLLSLAILAVLIIKMNREGFSNMLNYPSTYNNLLLNSFKPSEEKGYKLQNYSQQVKNIPNTEMSSYTQVTNNISPDLRSSPCNGNEYFPSMCSSFYTTY